MANKDYTDFVALVLGSGERVYYTQHIRNRPEMKLKSISVNGHSYAYIPDRAYHIRKWGPLGWRWFNGRHFFKSMGELFRRKKVGLLIYKEPCNHLCKACEKKKECPVPPGGIEPYHISRIHQPSGRNLEEPAEKTIQGAPSLLEVVSPAMLKDYLDNRLYAQAFGTFKFGKVGAVASKYWVLIVVGVIAAIIIMLYLTGYLNI